jgi:hypothetical protein
MFRELDVGQSALLTDIAMCINHYRLEAFAVLRDCWPGAPADFRDSLLVASAMFRLPAANDFLIGLIAGKDPSARAAISALAINRHNRRSPPASPPRLRPTVRRRCGNGSERSSRWSRPSGTERV